MQIHKKYPEILFVLVFGLLMSLLGNFPAVFTGYHSTTGDWQYFNAQSLFTRSAIVHYQTLYMYDPWFCGGSDKLANPQNRIFSPTTLLDILLSAQLANAMSLVIYGTLGFLGSYFLLRHYKISLLVNLICSSLFINAQWFGLHFAEGHIPFGTFLLLPWVLYSIIHISRRKYMLLYASLCTFFILDGGFYPLVYSIVLLFCALILGLTDRKKIFNLSFWSANWWFILLLLFFFLATSAIKMIPVMTNRTITSFFTMDTIPFTEMWKVLFYPFSTPSTALKPLGYMHEYGCYVGAGALIIILLYLCNTKNLAASKKLLLAAGIFFWIGTGWGGWFNPWALFQYIPLVNIVHIQARYFLLMYFFLVIILAQALQALQDKNSRWFYLALLLLVESCLVRIYPLYIMYQEAAPNEKTPITRALITNNTIMESIRYGANPKIYHYLTGQASVDCYEPMGPITEAQAVEDPAYRGEIYFRDPEVSGTAVYTEVIPGRLRFEYFINNPEQLPAIMEVNLNYLSGWKVTGGNARIYDPNYEKLIFVQVAEPSGIIELQYDPWYLAPALAAFIAGLLTWICLLIIVHRTREADTHEIVQ